MNTKLIRELRARVRVLETAVGRRYSSSTTTGLTGEVNSAYDHIKELRATVKEQAGLIEQLAALHGKEVAAFEPTTSEHSVVLVDAS